MYNPALERQELNFRRPYLARVLSALHEHATSSNLIGLIASIFALFCLIALHEPWNIRLPLYLVLVIWTLLRPRMALYLMPIAVAWGSLDTLSLGGLHLNSADILVALLAASWLMSFALHAHLSKEMINRGPLDREMFNTPHYLVVSMLILLLLMLISIPSAFSLTSSIKEFSKWFELLVLILLGAQYIRTRRQVWTIITIVCIAAISQACLGYAQELFNLGPQAFIRSSLRVYGSFDQPNPFAGYINMSLTIVIALMLLARNSTIRILAGITVILLGYAEYLSGSRGGEIAITISIIFIVTVGMPRLRKLISVSAIGVLAILAAYLAGRVPERYILPILRILGLSRISFTQPSIQDFSTAERLAHWIAGINMFLSHPFIRLGIGNYPDAYSQYYITIFVNSLGHAHNYYINIAAEIGLFGLIAFLLFLTTAFIAGGRSYKAINKHYAQVKTQRTHPNADITSTESQHLKTAMGILTNDRALAIGLLAALLSVCVHNMVDNLYVHSMTNLFALLLIALIRLNGVTQTNRGNDGGRFDH